MSEILPPCHVQGLISHVATAHVRSINQGEKETAQVIHTLSTVYDRWRAKVNATFWEAQGKLTTSGTRPSSSAAELRGRTNLGGDSVAIPRGIPNAADALENQTTNSTVARVLGTLQNSNSAAGTAGTAGSARSAGSGSAGSSSMTAADVLNDVAGEQELGSIDSSSNSAAHILRDAAASHDDTITAGTSRTAGVADTAGSAGNRAASTKAVLPGTKRDDLAEALALSSVRTAVTADSAGSAGQHSTLAEDSLLETLADGDLGTSAQASGRTAGSAGSAHTAGSAGVQEMSAEDSFVDMGDAEELGVSAAGAARTAGSTGTAREFEFVNPASKAHTAEAMSAADIMQDIASDQTTSGASAIDDESRQDRQGLPASHALRARAQNSNTAIHDSDIADFDGDVVSDSVSIAHQSATEAARRHTAANAIRESVPDMASEDDENVSLGLPQHASQRAASGMTVCSLPEQSSCFSAVMSGYLSACMCICVSGHALQTFARITACHRHMLDRL